MKSVHSVKIKLLACIFLLLLLYVKEHDSWYMPLPIKICFGYKITQSRKYRKIKMNENLLYLRNLLLRDPLPLKPSLAEGRCPSCLSGSSVSTERREKRFTNENGFLIHMRSYRKNNLDLSPFSGNAYKRSKMHCINPQDS